MLEEPDGRDANKRDSFATAHRARSGSMAVGLYLARVKEASLQRKQS